MQVSGAVEAIQGILRQSSAGHAKAQRVPAAASRQESIEVGGRSREGENLDLTKGRLRKARLFRKQEHRALFAAKRQLKQIAHAVRDELKEIVRAADGKDIGRVDDGPDDHLKHTLRELNKGFRQDLKQAFRDARDGGSLNGEQLIADTRAAFERLVKDVKLVLDPVAAEPAGEEDDGQAIGLAPVRIKPLEAAEPTGSTGLVEISALNSPNGGAASAAAPEKDSPLAEFIERIENLLARLTELVSSSETEERPLEGSFTVEIAVTVYVQASISFEGQASGSALDAVT